MSETSSSVPRRKGKPLLLLILVALAGGGAWWATHRGGDADKGPREEIPTVALAPVTKGDIDIIDRALGTVTPLADVTVRTQINGQLQEIAFQEGQTVAKGDFLAQIDPRPYQMALEQAMGALQKDQALLKDAQINLTRYQKLAAQNAVSKQQLDAQTALVEQYRGNVTSDQGQVDAAKLNIAYCHITAPIGGRVGLRQVDAGNYVQTSDANGIVALTQIDPISVVFTLPEDRVPAVMKRVAAGAVLPVVVYDRGETARLAEGKMVATDNAIDTATGTLKLRAVFDNAGQALFPNQFVNVHITVDTVQGAVLAPQAAVLRGTSGSFVYLAQKDGTVAVRSVKTGVAQGGKVEILEGLGEGDQVVTEGVDKLREGAKFKTAPSAAS